jgi:polar amino acid transport system substrate-binding protein
MLPRPCQHIPLSATGYLLAGGLYLAMVAAALASTTVEIETDENYPPYSFVENGQLKGIYIDFIQQAAHKLEPAYTVKLIPTPWKRGLRNLELGHSLALLPPYMTNERNAYATFSVPLLRESIVLFCHEGIQLPATPRFPMDFKGKTIGINRGFFQGEKLLKAVKSGAVIQSEVTSNEQNLRMLHLKRIDCYASDRFAARFSVQKLRAANPAIDIKLHERVELAGETAYIAYSRANTRPDKEDFIRRMNAAIEEARREGLLTQAIHTYSR